MSVKKVISLILSACLVLAFGCTCFAASGDGEQGFVDAINENITADTMWGAVTPVVSIIGFIFVFAFAYRIIRRVLKKGSQGKFGM